MNKRKEENNPISPDYYSRLDPQPIDLQMSWDLPAFLFNALKYIARAGYKNDAIEDCKKAIKYLEYEIKRLEKRKKEK